MWLLIAGILTGRQIVRIFCIFFAASSNPPTSWSAEKAPRNYPLDSHGALQPLVLIISNPEAIRAYARNASNI
ncbi:hypothetical protein RRF57_008782 [Xylaria bambusicola]|uniref:Uncharacterized protein n=1 Tax=Xylaria bambusicola TaxID=326684 RepID=A0AAN7ZBM1_9PEZI